MIIGTMVTEERYSPTKLTVDQVYAICREWVPIGNMAYDYTQRLRRTGFNAFQPYGSFFRSFAKTPDEFDLHWQIHVERTKAALGNPWPPLYVRPEYRRPLFKSSLLEDLKARRDIENEVPEAELEKRYPRGESLWRREIDPCWQCAAYLQVTDPEVYSARWNEVIEAMRLQVQKEAGSFATHLSKAHAFDRNGRYALFAAVMERDAAELGYRHDKSRSRSNFPVFSKTVADEWDLCWAIEEPNMFSWSPFEGHFMPHLQVRHRNLRGSVSKAEACEYLQIRYAVVVPGFFNAYRTFHGSDELETMIKAHLCLYGLMAPTIERGLTRVLSEGTGRTA